MKNTLPTRIFIHSALGLGCAAAATSAAARPNDVVQPRSRAVGPIVVAPHNEQGDVNRASQRGPGCFHGVPWFSGIGFLGNGAMSDALGLSPDGQVVVGLAASLATSPSGVDTVQAITWDACTGIAAVPNTPEQAVGSSGLAISDTYRRVAGAVQLTSTLGCIWHERDGVIALMNLNLPMAEQSSVVSAISTDASTVAGTTFDATGSEAFVFQAWSPLATMLGDLPGGTFASEANGMTADGSVVVGRGTSAQGREAFIWSATSGMIGLGDLAGGLFDSNATAVSNNGVVVGYATSARGREAFRWTAQTGMVALGDLPGGAFASEALAVSSDGRIIVGRATTARGSEAFIWDETHGMRNLHDLMIPRFDQQFSLWTLTSARSVSASGTVIVGSGINPAGQEEGWYLEMSQFCVADWNNDGVVNTTDFFGFIENFFQGHADVGGDGVTNTQDFFDYLASFFSGC